MEEEKETPVQEKCHSNWYKFFDALSLSGATTFLFFSVTILGILKNQKDVWEVGMTALTTFVTTKKLGNK